MRMVNPYALAPAAVGGTFAVAASADDGYWIGTGTPTWDDSNAVMQSGTTVAGAKLHPGIRWSNITGIPQGTVLSLAEIRLRSFSVSNGGADFDIYGGAYDAMGPWVLGSIDPSPDVFVETTAKTNGVVTTTGNKTFDVTAPVNEIIARLGWTGTIIAVALQWRAGASNDFVNFLTEDSTGLNPELILTP